jgi:hypothetical protein
MAVGLAVPIRVNRRGGSTIVSGDDNNKKLLYLALTDNDNLNAFQQDIGMSQDTIFGVDNTEQRSIILKRLRTIFAEFETLHRFRLMDETITWTSNPDEGEQILEFRYHDLESDEIKEFRKEFATATGV